MKKLKVGIVGVGSIARAAHIPAYLSMDDAQITAVCDIRPEKTVCDATNAAVYTDYRKMIDGADIDAVDICTPNYLHSEIAAYALGKGKHVFCEKPDAISVAERKRMSEAQAASGKVLMVMRNNRYVQSSKYLKEYIADGKAGEIYCGRCGWVRRRGIPGKGGWFTTKEQSGGGPLIDLGVHMIDLAIYLMGNPRAVSVSGSTYCKFANAEEISDSEHSAFGEKNADGVFDVEDLATGFIRFDNGASLQIEFSWASNIREECRFVELRGTKAGISWKNETFEIYTEDNGILQDIIPKNSVWLNGHAENLKHFRDVVLYGAKSDFESAQGENMVKILAALYESAQKGKEIAL